MKCLDCIFCNYNTSYSESFHECTNEYEDIPYWDISSVDDDNADKKCNAFCKTLEDVANMYYDFDEIKIGNMSDGYHTFNELYHHRAILFSVICNQNKEIAWKSKKHDDGTMFDNMFIVGIETSQGQATYHYDIEPYWNMFNVKSLDFAPKWDGHTSEQAIERIKLLTT